MSTSYFVRLLRVVGWLAVVAVLLLTLPSALFGHDCVASAVGMLCEVKP